MTEAARQQEFIDTLKAFNNAVVSIRLYPAGAPQITNAVERGYKAIRQHIKHYGDITLGLKESEPIFCGQVLSGEILQSISNLVVYRQLALLELEQLLLSAGTSRAIFEKILEVFNSKVEKIKNEGGGRPYITQLGLSSHFPEYHVETDPSVGDEQSGLERYSASDIPPLPREYINVLLGRETDPKPRNVLREELLARQRGPEILAGACYGVLRDMQQKRFVGKSASLVTIIDNCCALLPENFHGKVLTDSAKLLLDHLEPPQAALLLAQKFSSGAGEAFENALINHTTLESFGEIIDELRHHSSRFRLTQATGNSPQQQFIADGLDRLLASARGKQHLGKEKAKTILAAGEKARRGRRVQAGVKALMTGDFQVLESDEFTTSLPLAFKKILAGGLETELANLLTKLELYTSKKDTPVSESLMASLAEVGENLVFEKRFDLLTIIAKPFLRHIQKSDNGDFTYEKICLILQALMEDCWRQEKYTLGDTILSLFYQIRSGALKKPQAVRSIVGRAQDKGINREVLPSLLQQCLDAPSDETISRRLILQGPIVSNYLVDAALQDEDTADRVKIIDLLTYGEQFLPPILIKKIDDPMPWYGKRNLLKLFAETGSEKHLEMIYPFLQHEDLRVQREAFVCIYKISGKKRKKSLLKALGLASETMKLQIIRALIPFADAEVARALGPLLADHSYFSEELRDSLLANVCSTLGRCNSSEAKKALTMFLELRNNRQGKKVGNIVWQAAESAMKQLAASKVDQKKQKALAGRLRKSALGKANARSKAQETTPLITGLDEEIKIRKLLEKGEVQQAKDNLLQLIARLARIQRFKQAEQLREWLISIDSMALSEIIKAAEIIEEEKQSAVDKWHQEVWAKLYDTLSTDEFNAFYQRLTHTQFGDDEVLVKKGEIKTCLYFINSGKVKLYYWQKDENILVKTIGSGEVLGADIFFDSSVWTVSAATLGKSDISVLELGVLEGWKDEHPGLEGKLFDFCKGFEGNETFFKNSQDDRRQYQRHPLELRLSTALLGESGMETGITSKGDLFDISRGGLSFIMRISKKENSRLLLGRDMRIMLPIEETAGQPIVFEGRIVAIRALHTIEFEYSIHLEFAEPMERKDIERLVAMV